VGHATIETTPATEISRLILPGCTLVAALGAVKQGRPPLRFLSSFRNTIRRCATELRARCQPAWYRQRSARFLIAVRAPPLPQSSHAYHCSAVMTKPLPLHVME
jgi:hypothetical protein